MRRTLGMLLAVMALPLAAQTPAPAPAPAPVPTLVLIELAGGVDGLNAVVPLDNTAYTTARPTLALQGDQRLPLNDAWGLHKGFASTMDSWKAGDFAIVQGVGYPHPNRSHFRSIAIWDAASDANQVISTGWLARLFAAAPRWPGLAADSLILGETHAGPLDGPGMNNLSFDNLDAFLRDAASADDPGQTTGTAAAIAAVQKNVQASAQVLAALKPAVVNPPQAFPDSGLGRQMKLAYQLLAAGARVPVVKLTLRGFDTHTNQAADMARLLKDLSDAVAAFRANAIQSGLWDRVVVLTYSEFGRRVAENGTGGTDHGTAGPMFVWGGRVVGGFWGTAPSLTDLDQGDLKYSTDFRSVFRTVAAGLWGFGDPVLDPVFPGQPVLPGLIKPTS